jgi:AcrR family transcriptional regulator
MSKAAQTRQFIIERIAPIFNVKGFEGTSLNDLTEATGLTKGSLYGNFRDKEDIAIAAFEYSMKRIKEAAGERTRNHATSHDKLLALMAFYASYVEHPVIEGGCPILNTAVEADDFHLSLKPLVKKEIQKVIAGIASLIEEGKQNGEFRKDVNSQELAYILFSSIEGALMISRVSSSDVAMKAVLKHFKSILNQIRK